MSPSQGETLHYVSPTGETLHYASPTGRDSALCLSHRWDSVQCLPHRVRLCTLSLPQGETLHYVSPTGWDSALCLPHRVRLCTMSPPQGETLHRCLPHRVRLCSMALPGTRHSEIKLNICIFLRSVLFLMPSRVHKDVKLYCNCNDEKMEPWKKKLLIFFILNRILINTYKNNCTLTIFYMWICKHYLWCGHKSLEAC